MGIGNWIGIGTVDTQSEFELKMGFYPESVKRCIQQFIAGAGPCSPIQLAAAAKVISQIQQPYIGYILQPLTTIGICSCTVFSCSPSWHYWLASAFYLSCPSSML